MEQRIPPHSNEAEQSVLGAMLLSKDALFEAQEILKKEDFYNEAHKEIFDAMVSLARVGEPVDVVTLCERLAVGKMLEMVGGRAYIAHLSMQVPATANVIQYCKIVSEKAVLRSLISASDEILVQSYQEKVKPEEILDTAERKIFEIAQGRQKNDVVSIKDVLWENLAKIDELSRMDGNITGLSTGFRDLDAKTSGLQKSDLIMIAARPAMGKTAFALNIAQHAAIKEDATVLIFSLEMSRQQLGQRLLSMESRIEMQKLKTGKVDLSDWESMHVAIDGFARGNNIYIDDTPGISAMEIKSKCRRLKAQKKLDLIIVDYLQLMVYDGKADSRQQEISALSRFLKLLAREMDCPVIVLSQLSRAPEQRTDHRPVLSDLRESGSIEQDADVVMFLYRDEYYNPETTEKPNVCDVIIAKQRSGPTGTVELTWLGKYTRFRDQSYHKEQ